MKIIAISQVYWPDTVSVSQHLTDLLEYLAVRGHKVTIYTSKNDYENPKIHFKNEEIHNGVIIKRFGNTSFGKAKKVGRVIDFLSFNFILGLNLVKIKRKSYDLMIGVTVPPLLSYIGIKLAILKKIKFLYWTMDLQPELSIISGYLSPTSKAARSLQKKGDFIFKKSDIIITLDKYMGKHIYNRIGNREKIFSVSVWPVMNTVYDGSRLSNPFRIENKFGDRIVIMYSGNHSVVHPLDTLINIETSLKDDKRFLFVHIGSGVRLKDVIENKKKYDLDNVVILPYQPRENIHLSLGSSDIQVVVLGDNCVGYTHPNKIYGAMFIGKPILYIGPKSSHVTDVLDSTKGNIIANHGEVKQIISKLELFALLSPKEKEKIGEQNAKIAKNEFTPEKLINSMAQLIEKHV